MPLPRSCAAASLGHGPARRCSHAAQYNLFPTVLFLQITHPPTPLVLWHPRYAEAKVQFCTTRKGSSLTLLQIQQPACPLSNAWMLLANIPQWLKLSFTFSWTKRSWFYISRHFSPDSPNTEFCFNAVYYFGSFSESRLVWVSLNNILSVPNIVNITTCLYHLLQASLRFYWKLHSLSKYSRYAHGILPRVLVAFKLDLPPHTRVSSQTSNQIWLLQMKSLTDHYFPASLLKPCSKPGITFPLASL